MLRSDLARQHRQSSIGRVGCSPPLPASAPSPPLLCLLSCRNLVSARPSSSLLWSALPPSTTTAVHAAGSAPSAADENVCVTPSTSPPSAPLITRRASSLSIKP